MTQETLKELIRKYSDPGIQAHLGISDAEYETRVGATIQKAREQYQTCVRRPNCTETQYIESGLRDAQLLLGGLVPREPKSGLGT